MPFINQAMTHFIQQQLQLTEGQASALRTRYWRRYGATILGMVKHHATEAADFLESTHQLPGLEKRLQWSTQDRYALSQLPGRKYVVTNSPRAYALRVIRALRLLRFFDGVIAIEDMRMFGHMRPKPDARMLRRLVAHLQTTASRCVLVEDSLGNQRQAFRVGIRTAWMQSYLGLHHAPSLKSSQVTHQHRQTEAHTRGRPAYVCVKIKRLRSLRTFLRPF